MFTTNQSHLHTTGTKMRRERTFTPETLLDKAHFIVPVLCWTWAIVWGIFDAPDVSGPASTPIEGRLDVVMLTDSILLLKVQW
jgi:hypothetical protein